MIYLRAAFSRSLRIPRLCKGWDLLVAGAWQWIGHLVLCLHHYNIKLLVCLAWIDNQSTEITPVLFVLVKNFCPPAIDWSHSWQKSHVLPVKFSFHRLQKLFVFSQEGLPYGWPRFSFLATLNGNHFLKCGNSFSSNKSKHEPQRSKIN